MIEAPDSVELRASIGIERVTGMPEGGCFAPYPRLLTLDCIYDETLSTSGLITSVRVALKPRC